MSARAESCAEVHVGLDRRAIPTTASYDAFVGREAGTLATLAPESRVYRFPGTGVVIAFYQAATGHAAMARCEQTIASYLARAPNLPLIGMGSAASVTEPCAPCHTEQTGAGAPQATTD